jgi:ubiquinone/menaquinone biosynthesis C-methylase UbiE
MADQKRITSWVQTEIGTDEEWERAYKAFETPEEEIAKFKKRLISLGAADWPRDADVVELFCGRGNGLIALEEYGFTSLEGVDLSKMLLKEYPGKARLYVGDCRALHFNDNSKDIVLVQGGLHHLPILPDDLEKVLLEVQRILKPGGRFIFVEPWQTPFLAAVHYACSISVLTSCWPKLKALHDMIEGEKETYFRWLGQKEMVVAMLDKYFLQEKKDARSGKLFYIGVSR